MSSQLAEVGVWHRREVRLNTAVKHFFVDEKRKGKEASIVFKNALTMAWRDMRLQWMNIAHYFRIHSFWTKGQMPTTSLLPVLFNVIWSWINY